MTEPRTLIPHTVSPETSSEFAAAAAPRLPGGALQVATTPAETDEMLPDAEVLVGYRLPENALDRAPDLEWIQALSAGVDHLDLAALSEAGVVVTSASGVHAHPAGEQVLGYLLTFERNFHTALRRQVQSHWRRGPGTPGELRGKTIGVVGVGAIGTRVAELAGAFGMEVLGVKRDPSTAPDAVDEAYTPDDLFSVLERADYVVLACPLTDETRGLIGTDELRVMGSDAVLVNVARGEVVEEDALVRALRRDAIGGAALDVFEEEPLPEDSPLWDLENAVVTPHVAGATPHYTERCVEIFVENYERFREGDREGMRNRVR